MGFETPEGKRIVEFGQDFRRIWSRGRGGAEQAFSNHVGSVALQWFFPQDLYVRLERWESYCSCGNNCGGEVGWESNEVVRYGYARTPGVWSEEYGYSEGSEEDAVLMRQRGLRAGLRLEEFSRSDLEARKQDLERLYGKEFAYDILNRPPNEMESFYYSPTWHLTNLGRIRR